MPAALKLAFSSTYDPVLACGTPVRGLPCELLNMFPKHRQITSESVVTGRALSWADCSHP